MPELPEPKVKPPPPPHVARVVSPVAYAELQVMSNFTFLRGGSHPEELVGRAAELGYRAVAVTDVNTLGGVVRGHVAAKAAGIPLVVGCRVEVEGGLSVLLYPTDRAAYGRVCRMLTVGKRRAEKGECVLRVGDVVEHGAGSLAVVVAPVPLTEGFAEALGALRDVFDEDRLSVAASCRYDGQDERRLGELAELGRRLRVPLVATNDVHTHVAERRALQDVLTCIRLGCTLEQAGLALFANAERHLKEPEEMARLFRGYPEALGRTIQVAQRAAFNLDELKYEYPAEICPAGRSMMEYLVERTWEGARQRYPQGIDEALRRRLEHEFALIKELNYPAYFLTVDDIVRFARARGILCQGRGAAANSAVCYCLGVTAVDPQRVDLLVERFISVERDEPPDIDIDFEHERREEVIQYIYEKYGRDRAALTAEVISYRRRSAVREVGKALGLSLDCVDRLAKSGDWWDRNLIGEQRLRELGLDPQDATIRRTMGLARELIGFPRHRSQHVGGFVISRGPLCESVPIENAAMADRTVIEWDKDDIEELGMLKVDVLGLGMLTCIRKAIDFVNGLQHEDTKARRDTKALEGFESLQFHTVPAEDPGVYDMLCRADSVGVFQVESRAQMTMLPRLRPRCYYDLVIEVAIVRPGPIQGGMVHPYLRRRNGEEAVEYPNERIREVLGRTLGVPLFQEQAMRLVMVAAGFTAGEADQLRRAMAAWKRKGDLIHRFGRKIMTGMSANGYSAEFAHRVVEQIKGFSEYGFPESHAASFALLVYVSAWLKRHHPAAFAAALINSQPMGFYAPAQIIRDAREHGVEVLPIDVNHSAWDCTLETINEPQMNTNEHESNNNYNNICVHSGSSAARLRLGLRLVSGLRREEGERIAGAVGRQGALATIPALWRASGVRVATMRLLAGADAFGSMGLDRQRALWEVRALRDEALPMFDGLEAEEAPTVLPAVPAVARVVHDYAATGLSLKAHPMSFARRELTRLRVMPTGQLADEKRWPHGKRIAVAGLALVRQRPGTAHGIVFMTIEDETGVANLVIRPPVYERYRRALRHSVGIIAAGKVERVGQVVHVLVEAAWDLAQRVHSGAPVEAVSRDFH